MRTKPLILVTVGTDHHPFDRLISWMGTWLLSRPEASVDCLMQIGTSKPPAAGEWVRYMTPQHMSKAMSEASVIVAQAGPGTIWDSRTHRRIPVVLPRRSALGEHVDDHQVRFAARLALANRIVLVESPAELSDAIQRCLAAPSTFRADDDESDASVAVERFEGEINAMLSNGRRRMRVRR